MTDLNRSALLMVPVELAFAVVNDILKYPEFLPGCDNVELLEIQTGDDPQSTIKARVDVGAKGMSYSFITRNAWVVNQSIEMFLEEGPFEVLEGIWTFKALSDQGCRIDLSLNFVVKGLLSGLFSPIANSVADRMVDAFTQRIQAVRDIYIVSDDDN